MSWLDQPEKDYPICPICGAECCELFEDNDGNIVGCDECIKTIDAWDWKEREKYA